MYKLIQSFILLFNIGTINFLNISPVVVLVNSFFFHFASVFFSFSMFSPLFHFSCVSGQSIFTSFERVFHHKREQVILARCQARNITWNLSELLTSSIHVCDLRVVSCYSIGTISSIHIFFHLDFVFKFIEEKRSNIAHFVFPFFWFPFLTRAQ